MADFGPRLRSLRREDCRSWASPRTGTNHPVPTPCIWEVWYETPCVDLGARHRSCPLVFPFTLPAASAPQSVASTLAPTQDAQNILEKARAMQVARWAEVDNYTITMAVDPAGGLQTPMYYERIEIGGQPAFRLVPQTEYERRVMTQAGFPPPGPEMATGLAKGYDLLGKAFAAGGHGMPPIDITPMTSQMSAMLRMGASYQENDGTADAKTAIDDMAEFARRARLIGTERTDAGREAFLIVADDLFDIPLEQPKGGGEYRLEKASLWLDTEHYVPLRLKMEGQVTRRTRPPRSPSKSLIWTIARWVVCTCRTTR